MAGHKPRKSAPTEYTTDDEDMLMYDVEEELEPDRNSHRHLLLGEDAPECPSCKRREYGSNICDSRNYDTEECCRDTLKSVSPPRDHKKNRKTRIKESGGAIPQKKRGGTSLKLHDMGDDVMDIHASQSDESLMDDLSPRPSSSGSLRGARAKT
ncbi:hypothetical protein TNCV_2731701 [Trichonephila clavipes]|nr:hypothetical protein TNCV_2731701 [Trichonephila clavipes]